MGLEREIDGVRHGEMLPLSEKWVITISSQYGCSQGCQFCDVPNVGPGRNATYKDMVGQVMTALSLHPEITSAKRINVHYARMGEPTYNNDVLRSAIYLAGYFANKEWGYHPVISTMMPNKISKTLYPFLFEWCVIKNEYLGGNAGLQISINTTDESARGNMFNQRAMTLKEISRLCSFLPNPKGRKYTLNFAITDAPIDAKYLSGLFDPRYWLCKITPMHITNSCEKNGLLTKDGYEKYYPYRSVEVALKENGFDVIVFIPSKEEDESRITCGNAILSDKWKKAQND